MRTCRWRILWTTGSMLTRMALTVTALPVGQGDAFLLRTRSGNVLVDGGKSQHFLPELLRRQRVKALRVVACTHADADHANGLIGLLRDPVWFGHVREVWLPGGWSERLHDLIARPDLFEEELLGDIERAPSAYTLDVDAPDDYAPRPGDTGGARGGEELAHDVADLSDEIAHSVDGHESPYLRWPYRFLTSVGSEKAELWHDAVRCAERIRDIATAAVDAGVLIRWFDFDEAERLGSASGGERFLRPINSVEITRKSTRPRPRALEFLRLSLSNRRSLVFTCEAPGGDAAALLTADSDLASIRKAPTAAHLLVTAPHHGAESNSSAYSLASGWSTTVETTWIRSDGCFSTRPGLTYLNQKTRYCTRCRLTRRPRSHSCPRAIDVRWNGKKWTADGPACRCTSR